MLKVSLGLSNEVGVRAIGVNQENEPQMEHEKKFRARRSQEVC